MPKWYYKLQMYKALLTGGCSFSDDHYALHTWNTYLEDMYDDDEDDGIQATEDTIAE